MKKFAALVLSTAMLLGAGAALIAPQSVSAGAVNSIRNGTETTNSAAGGAGDLTTIAGTIINTMLFIVGLLAVVMIIFSGIRYITAHGDKNQVESAKNTLMYSVVGLVIAIIAYALVSWIVGLFDNSSSGTNTTSMTTFVAASTID